MAIAENAPDDRPAPPGRARLDLVQQFIGEVRVLGSQIVGHPVAVEDKIARLATQLFHGQARPLDKACGSADGVDAAQESAHPLPIVADPELRPAAATAWKH